MRHGSSMLEVLLALAILATALTVTLESMVSVSSYADVQGRESDLVEQSRRIARHLHDDLANSGWFLAPNSDTGQLERLFPRVIAGGANSYGDEFQFLRLTSERLPELESTGRTDHVDFINRPPVAMDAYPRGDTVRSLILNPSWSPTNAQAHFAVPAWESASGVLAYADARDATRLRHYRYIVRPDLETTGRGVLLREYRNGSFGKWTTDRRIADNIVSLRFTTNAEEPSLNANQIRVTVSLQADDLHTGKARATRQMDVIVAMRSGSTH